MKSLANKYIARIEHPSGNSGFWWVRFFDNKKGKQPVVHCTFTDREYGSKRASLQAARAWRDKIAQVLGKPSSHKHNYRKKKAACNSNTGVLGVSLVDYFSESRQRQMTYYSVQWSESVPNQHKRRVRTKMFSFDPLDEYERERAFRHAKRWRRKMEKQHYVG